MRHYSNFNNKVMRRILKTNEHGYCFCQRLIIFTGK
jgi:hypothetical protein